MRFLKQAIFAGTLIVAASSGASASSWECDSGPAAGWKSVEEARVVVEAEGYVTGKVKVDGGCYEFYSKKDGKKVEVFVNPATLEIVKIKVK